MKIARNLAVFLSSVAPLTVMAQTDAAHIAGASESETEILVTARRREERNLDVPAAITAVSDDKLREQQIEETQEIQQVVPGLTQVRNASNANLVVFNIRGQGQTSGGGGDPSVLPYVNEVPAGSRNLPIYDLESVQVFKGPQGTLFGATLTGGAVMFTTKRPDLDEVTGYGQFTLGNFKTREYEAAVSVPIVRNMLAVRVAGKIERQRGFTIVDNIPGLRLDDRHSDSFRVSVRFKPDERIINDTIVDYYKTSTNGGAAILGGVASNVNCPALGLGAFNNLVCVFGQATMDAQFAAQQARGPRHTEVTLPPPGTSLDDWITDRSKFISLTNITSFDVTENIKLRNLFGHVWTKHPDVAFGVDYDGTTLPGFYFGVFSPPGTDDSTQLSDEFQIQGNFPKVLDFVVGGYIQRDKLARGAIDRRFIFPLFSFVIPTFPGRSRQDAVYGQVTLDGNLIGVDGLSLGLGGRYTWVKDKSFIGRPAAQGGEGHSSSEKFTYTVSLDYKPNDDLIFYVAHRTGYKPGGTNTGLILPPNASAFFSYSPETVKDLELGAKTAFRSGAIRGTANLAIFQQWYSNIQRNITVDAATTAITNAKKAAIKGLEFDASLFFGDRFRLSGFLALLDPKFKDYQAPFFGDGQASTPVIFNDLSATEFAGAAKTSYSVQAAYDLPFMPDNFGKLTLSGTFYHQSKVYTTDANIGIPGAFSPGYDLVKARLDWRDIAGTNLDVGIYVNNLTDNTYRQGGTAAVLQSQGWTWHTYGAPRTYGVEVRYEF